jgi:hypothetical protein
VYCPDEGLIEVIKDGTLDELEWVQFVAAKKVFYGHFLREVFAQSWNLKKYDTMRWVCNRTNEPFPEKIDTPMDVFKDRIISIEYVACCMLDLHRRNRFDEAKILREQTTNGYECYTTSKILLNIIHNNASRLIKSIDRWNRYYTVNDIPMKSKIIYACARASLEIVDIVVNGIADICDDLLEEAISIRNRDVAILALKHARPCLAIRRTKDQDDSILHSLAIQNAKDCFGGLKELSCGEVRDIVDTNIEELIFYIYEKFPDRQNYIAFQLAKKNQYNLFLSLLEKYSDSMLQDPGVVSNLWHFPQFWNPSSIPYFSVIMQKQPLHVEYIVESATWFGCIEIVRYATDNYPHESSHARPDEIPPTQELEDFWIERLISLKASNRLLRWIKTPEYCRKILGILEQRGLIEQNLSWWIHNIPSQCGVWTAAFDYFVKLEWSPEVYFTMWSKFYFYSLMESFTLEHLEAIKSWEGKWTAYTDYAIRYRDMKRVEHVDNYCRGRNLIRGPDWKSMQKYIDDPAIDNTIRQFLSEKIRASS